MAVEVATAADDKLASNLALYDVADVLAVVDVFAIASASSDRQVRAVVDNIEERLRETGDRRPLRREGTPESGWVLLDYGDVVAHVFQTDQRSFYDLDRLFSDVRSFEPLTGAVTREATRLDDDDPSEDLADAIESARPPRDDEAPDDVSEVGADGGDAVGAS
nr:ribosome silencing factor [Salsipaludibacter albus]